MNIGPVEQRCIDNIDLIDVVTRVVARRVPPYVDLDEVRSACNLSLYRAAVEYDPDRYRSFREYADWRMTYAALDALRALDVVPKSVRAHRRLVEEATVAWVSAHDGVPPTVVEVAGVTGLTVSQVDAVNNLDRARTLSLDHPQCVTALCPHPTPPVVVEARDMLRVVVAAARALPDPHRAVIAEVALQERMVNDVATGLRVTPSRVSQILWEARAMLRDGVRVASGYAPTGAGYGVRSVGKYAARVVVEVARDRRERGRNGPAEPNLT